MSQPGRVHHWVVSRGQIRRLDLRDVPEPQLLVPPRLYLAHYPGNRCHTQTKQHNSYLLQAYQEHLSQPPHSPPLYPTFALHPSHHCQPEGHFPSVVLLRVDDEPWEEQPQWWEHSEAENTQWVSTLIEGE